MSTIQEKIDNQWHLQQKGGPGKLDLNVVPAWADYTGRGVSVFVIDDGFDYNHSDLAPNYDRSGDFDFYGTNGRDGDDDPFGLDWNNHGTAVMGLIGAARNGTGAVGVAYNATLTGYRIGPSDGATFVENVANAIRNAADYGADTVNLSLSYPGLFDAGQDAGAVRWLGEMIDYAVETGRHGLGTILTKSAGNAREWGTDSAALSFNGNTHQVVVAAVNQNGWVSDYSNPGASVLVSGFGSHLDVVTTDRSGNAGWTNTDFVNDFDGTSAATAMVNGVVALILDANANLGWRDVQTILAYSARHVGSAVGAAAAGAESAAWVINGAKDWNGGGLHYSRDYGYGLVDALAAVRLAESWRRISTSANEASIDLAVHEGPDVAIDTVGHSFAKVGLGSLDLERVRLEIDFATTDLGDVEIYLTGPDGREVRLLADLGAANSNARGSTADFDGKWVIESQAFRGYELSGPGTWTVRVVDDNPAGTTIVRGIELTGFGSSDVANDTYVYTNEFSNHGAGRTVLNDIDGGSDWLNTAAVTAASGIRLDAGYSRIDGVSLAIRGIEHVHGGDGNDVIYGSIASNQIHGARGNDRIFGHNGNDVLNGGLGNDLIDGGAHNDRLHGGIGNDTLSGGAGNDSLFGEVGDDFLTGGAGRDGLYGGAGRDRFDYNSIAETGRAASTRDVIKDFARGYDRIDLSTIDANGSAAGNARFGFVAREGSAFTGTKGQLIWDVQNNAGTVSDRTIISGDLNGDRIADFSIELTGLIALRSTDFLL